MSLKDKSEMNLKDRKIIEGIIIEGITEDFAKKIVGTNWISRFWDGDSPEVCAYKQMYAAGYLERVEQMKEFLETADSLKQAVVDYMSLNPHSERSVAPLARASQKYAETRAKLDGK